MLHKSPSEQMKDNFDLGAADALSIKIPKSENRYYLMGYLHQVFGKEFLVIKFNNSNIEAKV